MDDSVKLITVGDIDDLNVFDDDVKLACTALERPKQQLPDARRAFIFLLAPPDASPAPGDLGLYPISVKTQSGEKLELQLNPGDSVMNLRQFLLEAPETCFFLCYDLILHAKDGSVHRLEDYKEISEAADITAGGCSLEMVAALYDDRSISMRRRKKGLQAKSKKAQESRAKLPYNHTSSSRSFASRMSLMIDGCFGIGCISI
ncbi:hypothetical protein AAC387_Pa08g1798 [Persea americana]